MKTASLCGVQSGDVCVFTKGGVRASREASA